MTRKVCHHLQHFRNYCYYQGQTKVSSQPDHTGRKGTKFKLFEGKNQQEHSLYLGHKDLFNEKSPAQFILDVKHRKGSEIGVTPLKGPWENWGETEGKEGWHEFQTVAGLLT